MNITSSSLFISWLFVIGFSCSRVSCSWLYGTHVTPCVNKSDTGVTPLQIGIFNESDEGIINLVLGKLLAIQLFIRTNVKCIDNI